MKFTLLILILNVTLYNNLLDAAQTQQSHDPTLVELLEGQMFIETKNGSLTQESLLRLLQQGAHVNAKDRSGYTALMWAADKNYVQIVEILIAQNTDLNAKDEHGYTALAWAVMCNSKQSMESLISAGAHLIDSKDTIWNKLDPYSQDKDAYDKAVKVGKKRRIDYFVRQTQAKIRIAEQPQLIPVIVDIIAEYAYSSSTTDLPENTQQPQEEQTCGVLQ